MFLQAELVCENAVFFDDTSYVEVFFERNSVPLEDTIGSSLFMFNGVVLPERRVAATGRACRYNMNDLTSGTGLGVVETLRSQPAYCGLDLTDDLKLRVKTNLTLDVGLFTKVFSVKLKLDQWDFDIPLSRPDVKIEWKGRGEYLVSLEPFLARVLTGLAV